MKNISINNIVFPAVWFIALLVILSLVMNHGYEIGLPTKVQDISAVLFGLTLLLGPVIIYAIGFYKNYILKERILAAILVPILWWLTEIVMRMTQGHSFFEALYLTFFIINLILYFIYVLLIVLTEIVCRIVAKRRNKTKVKIMTRPIWLIVAFLFLTALTVPKWIFPYFLGFQDGYRSLFMESTFEPFIEKNQKKELSEVSIQPVDSITAQPNIVVILSDDHRWDYMSNMNHPFIQTPNIDKIYQDGIRFNNAFVNASLCSPSRASFLTGQYPQQHGVFNNFTPWNNNNQTFFEYLKKGGYETAFIGKWHMPGGLPVLRGVDEFVTFTVNGGQGQYWDCPLIVNGNNEPSKKHYVTEELTDRGIKFIQENKDRPFVLYLSHKSVHNPFDPDTPEKGIYADEKITLPDGSHNWTSLTNGHYVHFMMSTLTKTMKNYDESITSMDRQIGRVMNTLDDLGLTENTVLLYTSDNGQVWGEHKEIDKRSATEPSIRIPWILRYPKLIKKGGQEIDKMVLNVDLFPSLLDLAGIQSPHGIQGRSILPLLKNNNENWRNDFYYNYYFEPPYTTQTVHTLRTERYKYNEYNVKKPELFDLEADPKEQINLIEKEGYEEVQTQMRSRLEDLKKEISD